MTATPNLEINYLSSSQRSHEITVNMALAALDVLVQSSVIDRDLTAPPGSPVDGDCYMPAAGATGLWAGWDDYLVSWFAETGVWQAKEPKAGWRVYIVDEAIYLEHDGSVWGSAAGGGTVTSVSGTGTVAGLTLTGTVTGAGNLTLGGTLSVDLTSMVTGALPIANGGTGSTSASTARTALGATTVGANLFTVTDPSAITFPRVNADNSVTLLSDSAFRTAIGAGGTYTGGTGITLTGSAFSVDASVVYTVGGTDVAVTDGGTGRSTSTTAYGLIAAGTTATGAHQTLAAGATTEILVGGGASALPVWTTANGTGAPVRTTSPALVTPALGTPASGNLSSCTADGTNAIGFRHIPQNSQSTAYTTVLADAGKHILHPSADTTARTWTIDSNANVAYPLGTAITFINQNAGGVITISITSDTMRLAGAGTTGNRSLAANGVATAVKITTTEWIISGTNLT
ncbi:MAG: DUF2793 domain-containing protein [Pseudomonadota bacterium]